MKRILVIKLRHLGDVLLTAPVFHLLKKNFPEAAIDAYIYKEALPMLEGHPAISNFFLYDRAWKKMSMAKRIKEEAKILLAIRKRGYDMVINLTEGDRGALAALVSGAERKVGFDPGKGGFAGKRAVFTDLVKNCRTPRHAVERNLDALRKIGIFPSKEDRLLELFIPRAAHDHVDEVLAQKGLRKGEFTAIHPVSRWRFKCLPPERMALLIRALCEQGEEVVLTAGPDEMDMVDEILDLANVEGAISLAGQLSLKELGALYLKARGLITVDSVPLHMASALKVPVVALFGPTSEENWGPWQHPRARVVTEAMPCRPCYMDGCGGSKRSDCLDTLSIQAILNAYEEVSAGVLASASSLLMLKSLATKTTE